MMTPHAISAYVLRHAAEGPRYLLIRRCGKLLPGIWQMVTGKIEEGETAVQAALREIREETGLEPTKLYFADAVETFYMPPLDKIAAVPVFVAFVDEATVQLSPTEHDAYAWLPYEEAKKRLIWSEQKRVLDLVHELFILQQPHKLLSIDLTQLSSTEPQT